MLLLYDLTEHSDGVERTVNSFKRTRGERSGERASGERTSARLSLREIRDIVTFFRFDRVESLPYVCRQIFIGNNTAMCDGKVGGKTTKSETGRTRRKNPTQRKMTDESGSV